MEIRAISAHQTWDIRQKSMWTSKPIGYVQLPEDDNGKHFGFYVENHLVSVISIFITGTEVQFRKFATLPNHQANGYGTSLLSYVFDEMSKKNINKIWCNARLDKTRFYEKFGMVITPTIFKRDKVNYVIMEYYYQER